MAEEPRPLVLEPNRYSYTFDVPEGWTYSFAEARMIGARLLFLPHGGSFEESPSIIYVSEVNCGARKPEECVIDRFRERNPDLRVTSVSPIQTKAETLAKVIVFDGISDPRQVREALAFLEQEETTVLVVLSTKNIGSWARSYSAFKAIVGGFEYFTCASPGLTVTCSD